MFWYLQALKKYADFRGRAGRIEYWTFTLVNLGISWIIAFFSTLSGEEAIQIAVLFLSVTYSLAMFLPGLAVSVRRLHDSNHSGWAIFIALIPIVGAIILLVWLIRDSDPDRNWYGSKPTYAAERETAVPYTRGRTFGIAALVIVLSVLVTGAYKYLIGRGTEDAMVLAPCTGISASAEEVANLDLAALGLRSSGKQDARSTYGEGFVDGAVIEYSAGGNPAAIVAALRYSSSTDAATIFSGMQEWAQGSCGRSSWASAGASGIIHCDLRDGHDLFLWKDSWILDIEAADLGAVPGAELADQIKDAILAHWLGLGNASVSRTYERGLVQ